MRSFFIPLDLTTKGIARHSRNQTEEWPQRTQRRKKESGVATVLEVKWSEEKNQTNEIYV
jgi:hypothetical protein